MPLNFVKGDKKQALRAYREKLLTEIYHYGNKTEEARKNNENKTNWIPNDSSDSDSEEIPVAHNDPPLNRLKSEQDMLKVCLQATSELTKLEILQSEVNVLVEAPPAEVGDCIVTKPGVWREIVAECCVGSVVFSITFYAHQSNNDKFTSILYRGLKVVIAKPAHESELMTSILPSLQYPSDVVEVIRNYSEAYRSRRATLAKLADTFGDNLFMETRASGGYTLKSANLLQMSWVLQNNKSPTAAFHHHMKFALDYMEEQYIRKISLANKKLSNPAIDTDERTLLLAEIVNTCLDVLSTREGDKSPPERRRNTTLDNTPERPVPVVKQLMAPPTSLPKKAKTKQNEIESKSTKRPIENADPLKASAKRAKADDKTEKQNSSKNKDVEPMTTNVKVSAAGDANSVAKSNPKEDKTSSNSRVNKTSKLKNITTKTTEKVEAEKKSANKIQERNTICTKTTHNTDNDKNMDKTTNKLTQANIPEKSKKSKNAVTTTVMRASLNSLETAKKSSAVNISRNSAPIHGHIITERAEKKSAKKVTPPKIAQIFEEAAKASENNVKNIVKTTTVTNEKGEVVKKTVKKLAPSKSADAGQQKTNSLTKNASNNVDTADVKTSGSQSKNKTGLNENSNKLKSSEQKQNKKVISGPISSTTNVKKVATSEKENTVMNKIKFTKIPMKEIGSPKTRIKKMPVRISPRTSLKPKTATVGGKIIIRKPVTGIPRLVSKPNSKVT